MQGQRTVVLNWLTRFSQLVYWTNTACCEQIICIFDRTHVLKGTNWQRLVVNRRRKSEHSSTSWWSLPIYSSPIAFIDSVVVYWLFALVALTTIFSCFSINYQSFRLNVWIVHIRFGFLLMSRREAPAISLSRRNDGCSNLFQRSLLHNPVESSRFAVCGLFGTDKNEIML